MFFSYHTDRFVYLISEVVLFSKKCWLVNKKIHMLLDPSSRRNVQVGFEWLCLFPLTQALLNSSAHQVRQWWSIWALSASSHVFIFCIGMLMWCRCICCFQPDHCRRLLSLLLTHLWNLLIDDFVDLSTVWDFVEISGGDTLVSERNVFVFVDV